MPDVTSLHPLPPLLRAAFPAVSGVNAAGEHCAGHRLNSEPPQSKNYMDPILMCRQFRFSKWPDLRPKPLVRRDKAGACGSFLGGRRRAETRRSPAEGDSMERISNVHIFWLEEEAGILSELPHWQGLPINSLCPKENIKCCHYIVKLGMPNISGAREVLLQP